VVEVKRDYCIPSDIGTVIVKSYRKPIVLTLPPIGDCYKYDNEGYGYDNDYGYYGYDPRDRYRHRRRKLAEVTQILKLKNAGDNEVIIKPYDGDHVEGGYQLTLSCGESIQLQPLDRKWFKFFGY